MIEEEQMLFIKADEFKVVANVIQNSEVELHIKKDRINFIDSDSSYRASLICVDTKGFEGGKWRTHVSLNWWTGVPSNARAAISFEQVDKGFIIYYLFFSGDSYMSVKQKVEWVA